ncbi:hypothetical protein B0H10DRAFT_1692192, partial [Mycena sp. CBHHK59/15]
IRHLHFFADNTAALASIFDPKLAAGQSHAKRFRRYVEEFLDLNPENTMDIDWSPGHKTSEGTNVPMNWQKLRRRCGAPTKPRRSRTRSEPPRTRRCKWTAKWKKMHPTGRLGPADRVPPVWKPKPHFTGTKREVYGRVVQCRTGHTFIGEYYTKFVPTERMECQCGEPFQTRITIPDILGTEKGIRVLAKFLERSGAFTKTG